MSYALHNYEVGTRKGYYFLRVRATGCSFGRRYSTREEAAAALKAIIQGEKGVRPCLSPTPTASAGT